MKINCGDYKEFVYLFSDIDQRKVQVESTIIMSYEKYALSIPFISKVHFRTGCMKISEINSLIDLKLKHNGLKYIIRKINFFSSAHKYFPIDRRKSVRHAVVTLFRNKLIFFFFLITCSRNLQLVARMSDSGPPQ